MSNLTLSIKQVYFNEILSGIKKTETRELRPKTNSKYLLHKDGNLVIVDNEIKTKDYKTITFLTGAYKGKRAKMVVEVLSSEVVLYEDENGELITLTDENQEEYFASVIEYKLGEVIEKP
jgi:hypothetical protein